MAEDKKPKGPTAGARPKNWVAIKSLSGGVALPTNSTPQETIGEPRNFRNTAPISRPDAPELTEGLPEEAQDNSFLGGFLNLMDKAVPDDLGGLIRGETGWINNVPFAGDAYENTAGRVLGTGLDAGSAVVNAMNWGSEKMNHLGAAAFSALPGGIETLTWDQANDISLGQVVTANSAINNNSFGGWLINVATLQTPFALMSAKSESDNPDNALYLENFNILNKEQREAAFESGGLGQTMSGYADAIWMVAADPTIIGGKASSILRIGSKVGEFGGLSNQSLRTARQVSSFAERNTEQAAIIAKFGGDYKAALNSGELSTEGVRLADALNGTADSLINSVYVKNSTRKKTTLDILANETSMSNPAEGALVLNAISGHADSWVKIREVNKDLYDKLSTSMNQNIFDPVPGSAAADNMVGEVSDMTTDQAKFGDELIEEAENARAAAIADEAGVIDGAPPVADEALDVFSGQLIERGGARIGAPLVRAASAYRRGAASTNLQRNPLRKVQVPPTIPGNGHLVYDAIERTASSRPITAIRWVGKGTPNGIVDVKGGDGENSHREIANWLRRSTIQTDEATIYFNDFVAAQSPADRIAVIDRMELAYVKTVATKKNITPEAARAVYDGYKAKRAMTLRNISKTKTKFYADPDTGEMIKVPMFYAELDATIPMIDTKIFSRVVGGHQKALRIVESFTELADQINKVWKLSVLIRLGYTQRNIAEGFLRGVAVSGMIMANPQAFAALPSNILLSASVRRGLKGVATQERVLVQARDNLDNARGVLNQVFKDAGIAAGVSLRNDAAALTSQISTANKATKIKNTELSNAQKKLNSLKEELSENKLSVNNETAAIKSAEPAWENGKVLFHGTSSKIVKSKFGPAWERPQTENLLGSGAYTTDSPDIMKLYTKKGKGTTPAGYQVKWLGKGKPVVLDAEAVAPEFFRQWYRQNLDSWDGVDELVNNASSSFEELFKRIKLDAQQSGMTRNDAEELYDTINYLLQENGYSAVKHTGGLVRGSEVGKHQVYIWLDPEKISIKEIKLATPKRNELDGEIKSLSDQIKNSGKEGRKQTASLNKLIGQRDRLLAKANKIELTKTQPRLGQMNAARVEQNEAIRKVDELSKEIEDALTVLRIKDSRRKLLGKKGNVVAKDANGEDIIYAGAFEGPAGRAALLSSSADSTVRNVFEGSFQSRISSRNAQHDYDKIDPSKLAPEEMNIYWAEYAVRINRRYATDPVAQMIIRNEPIEDIKSWFTSPDGIRYRKDLGSPKNPMGNSTQIDTYLSKAIQRLDYELPQGSRLREISLRGDLTSTEVISAIGSSELPVLVGRLGSDEAVGLFKGAANKADTISSSLMKGLGSIPEDKLLRHPFYNNVYIARQKELGRLAQDQGQDLTSSVVQGRINRSAHASALKATRETMYTIEELSNVSQLLRWVSPFFPAFENAIRTWGRIAYTNPAVLGYGNLLWNVPNYMGMVVDENGDPVARSNMLKDENTWVILPREINNILQKRGIISPGQPLRVRQSGANVVFPGAEFWFPGAGPGLAVPLAAILRNKPEDQELLKNVVGENIYRQIVPNGNVNTNLVDSMLPTFVRRVKQMWQGETSDTAYVSLFNDMVEDAYINAQLEGRNISSKDYAKIESDVDKFWRWQIGAAAIAPFQSAYASPHQLQRDSWRKLIDDQSIPYIDKIKAFKEEFGYEYLAITRSTSVNETGLNPNLKTWSRIVENPSLVRDLYNINPELVGMFGNMGSFDDPFSYAVYGEFSGMKIGSDGKPVRSKLKPDQVLRNNQVVDGWSEYFQLMDAIESKVVQSGFSSLQVKDAQPLRDIRDETIALLSVKYEAWGQERSSYENSLPDFIVGARILVENSTILNEDSTMRALSDYLTLREAISDKLSQTSDSDIRDSLKDIGYAAAFDLRQSDIGFADFYDKYLSSDDFRKIYGS